MNNTIKILGTRWKIKSDKPLEASSGLCDFTTRTISLCSRDFEKTNFPTEVKNLDVWQKVVIRHEIMHAIAFECGLGNNSFMKDEECVDWFARMYPKIADIFEKLEIT